MVLSSELPVVSMTFDEVGALSTLERLIPTVESMAGSYDTVKGSAYQSPNTASVGS